MTDPFDKPKPDSSDKIPDLAAQPERRVSDRPGSSGRPGRPSDVNHSDLPGLQPLSQAPALELDSSASIPPRSIPLAGQSSWPTGKSPDPDRLAVDPVEVRVQSAYGPAPENFFQTPPYAVRVFQRRRELDRELVESSSRVQVAEARRDDLLIRMAEACREEFGQNERFASIFANLNKVEQLLGERQSALSGTSTEHSDALAALDQQLANNDDHERQLQADLALRTERFSDQDIKFSRAQAQHKRVLIEIRALKNAEEQARERGEPLDHSQKVLELSHQAQSLRPGVVELEVARAQAQKDIQQAEAQIERTRRESLRIESSRTELNKTFSTQLGLREDGVRDAQLERSAAAADAGRAILSLRGDLPVKEKLIEEIRAADAAVLREIKRQSVIRAARLSYDSTAYRRGQAILIGGVAVILMLILLKIVFGHGAAGPD